jgi:predicted ATP-dependent endonuclease of OLD family
MRLEKVQVTNFRSVEDSGEFDVGQVLCLVGKDESGQDRHPTSVERFEPTPNDAVHI